MSDLDRMPYCDWVIHRKLSGIDGRIVYIHLGRGSGKAYQQLELYKELFADGKDVRFVTKKDTVERHYDLEMVRRTIDYFNQLRQQSEGFEEIGKYIHEQYTVSHPTKPETVWITTSNPYHDWKFDAGFDFIPVWEVCNGNHQ